jgi:hypothetical protein
VAESVYFHVGAPKTGTTYLQDALWANRTDLAHNGVLIPGGRRFAAFHAAQAIREVRALDELPPGRRNVWHDMQRRIREWGGTAVVSHEFLGGASATQAAQAMAAVAPADVHVVVTARDYVTQLPALWQEAVKMGLQDDLDGYARKLLDGTKSGPWGARSVDIVGVLDRWGAPLPADHVHVVTVPPRGASPDVLWTRFGRACGFDPTLYSVPTQLANESLGVAEGTLVQAVAARLPTSLRHKRMRYRWLRGVLAHEVLAGRAGHRPRLEPRTAERVRAWGQSSRQVLAERGYDVVGDLDDLVWAPLPTWEDVLTVDDSALLDVALDTIAELLEQHRRLSVRLEEAQPPGEQAVAPTPRRRESRSPGRRRRRPSRGGSGDR